MEHISLDLSNPFLYLSGIAAISMITNLYCCYRNCNERRNLKILKQEEIELTEAKHRDAELKNAEFTSAEFTNVVLPSTTNTNNTTNNDTYLSNQTSEQDIETGIVKVEIETSETTTQTEDCELSM